MKQYLLLNTNLKNTSQRKTPPIPVCLPPLHVLDLSKVRLFGSSHFLAAWLGASAAEDVGPLAAKEAKKYIASFKDG